MTTKGFFKDDRIPGLSEPEGLVFQTMWNNLKRQILSDIKGRDPGYKILNGRKDSVFNPINFVILRSASNISAMGPKITLL